jgi:hypothetical protein
MIWLLLIYVMGVLLTETCLNSTIEYFALPGASLMWPIMMLGFIMEWIKENL